MHGTPPRKGGSMKNQYFGDINDYRKYRILSRLAEQGLRLGVVWMLTSDDGGTDGRKIEYLDDPARWRGLDPALFDFLHSRVVAERRRDVACLEGADLFGGARFVRDPVPEERVERSAWLSRALDTVDRCDVVFFDPDNGLVGRSESLGRRPSVRHLFWHEALLAYERGHSLMIYQHFPRKPRDDYAKAVAARLESATGAPRVEALATSGVLFLLAAQERHADAMQQAVASVASGSDGELRRIER
jgi:hypothetical protein